MGVSILFTALSSSLNLANLSRRTLTLMHLLLMRFRRVFRLMVTYLSLTTQHRLSRRCSDIYLRAFFVSIHSGSTHTPEKIGFRMSGVQAFREKSSRVVRSRVQTQIFYFCMMFSNPLITILRLFPSNE